MIENVFRITQEQLDSATGLLTGGGESSFVLVECGTGSATISMDCERQIWCVHKIVGCFDSASAVEVLKQHSGGRYFCVITRTVDDLLNLSEMSNTPVLWAYLDKGIIKAYSKVNGALAPVSVGSVIGHNLCFLFDGKEPMTVSEDATEFTERTRQAFGSGTTHYLSHLTVAVAGASGTGSIVAEQLLRLGVRRLLLIDDDVVEDRNLGRILNSTVADSKAQVNKAIMLQKVYHATGLPTEVIAVNSVVLTPDTIHLLSACDVVVGCLDSTDGREHLNRICTFYCIPYIDVGVTLDSDKGTITGISGAIRYLIPGGSTLLSRNVYTLENVKSDSLRRSDPEAYKARLKEKYIVGASESSPAVISVNMLVASLGVLELLARIHPYRGIPNSEIETVYIDLCETHFPAPDTPSSPDRRFLKYVGRGDCSPLLNMPALGG